MTPKNPEMELDMTVADRINDERNADEWVLDSINDYYMRMDG